ncbi:MAG: hypothetical protein AABX29_00080 [Nanoarchaeota archaeon]
MEENTNYLNLKILGIISSIIAVLWSLIGFVFILVGNMGFTDAPNSYMSNKTIYIAVVFLTISFIISIISFFALKYLRTEQKTAGKIWLFSTLGGILSFNLLSSPIFLSIGLFSLIRKNNTKNRNSLIILGLLSGSFVLFSNLINLLFKLFDKSLFDISFGIPLFLILILLSLIFAILGIVGSVKIASRPNQAKLLLIISGIGVLVSIGGLIAYNLIAGLILLVIGFLVKK